MRSAPHLFNEDARLAALAEYELQNASVPIDLQGIVDLTAQLFGVPIVLVSIVEREQQKFHARVGLDVCETGRDVSFCAHALALKREDILVVPDARLDLRFAGNPLRTRSAGLLRVDHRSGARDAAPVRGSGGAWWVSPIRRRGGSRSPWRCSRRWRSWSAGGVSPAVG